MENTELYIKYRTNAPVPIDTAFGRGPNSLPLLTVAHLIAAFQALPGSPLATTFVGDLSLHLPDSISRSACGLGEDCFASVDETDTILDFGCPLSSLGSLGSKSKQPLIISSNTGKFFYILTKIAIDTDSESQRASLKRIKRNKDNINQSIFSSLFTSGIDMYVDSEIPFYNDISKAVDSNEWLSFSQHIPSSTLIHLYIRESYEKIASSIISVSKISKFIITGTPGIGKSLFMIYLLWKLVKEGKRVLFIYHPNNIYYDGNGGVFELADIPSVIDHKFWNADLWCLFDAKGKNEANLSALPYPNCNFVLSTSPRREMVNDFQKPPTPQIFYMPIWNQTELETIAPVFPDVVNWEERFRILGGIPRHVLEMTERSPTGLLQAACKQCELNDCIKIIGLNSTITEKSKVVHSLVHITSTSPFTDSSVSYASRVALDIIVENKGTEAKRRIRELLASSDGNPLIAALCGYIFEPFAIELLEKGGNFEFRQLFHGNKKSNEAVISFINIPHSAKIVTENVERNQTQNQLYIPKNKNYTAIDAWIPGIGAFQMTVGKTHDIKGGVKEDLELLGANANKLYWLLPPHNYKMFTKKTPQEIDQYAVKIPYPTEDE